jgi:hypothetical protein
MSPIVRLPGAAGGREGADLHNARVEVVVGRISFGSEDRGKRSRLARTINAVVGPPTSLEFESVRLRADVYRADPVGLIAVHLSRECGKHPVRRASYSNDRLNYLCNTVN